MGNLIVSKYNQQTNLNSSDAKNSSINGKIENFKQSDLTNDCWLLGPNVAMRNTDGAKIIKNSIQSKENKIKIKLAGLDESYTFSAKTIEDSKEWLSDGDADTRALELAAEKHREKIISSGNYNINPFFNENLKNRAGSGTLQSPLDGGNANEGFYLLTGKKSELFKKSEEKLSSSDKIALKFMSKNEKEKRKEMLNSDINTALTLKEKYPKRFAMTATFKDEKTQLSSNHVYAIETANKDTIKIIDPYDTSKEIKIPKKEFVDNIESIISCDVKDN